MKKHLLFAALLTAAAGAAHAQITLTAASHMPAAGGYNYITFEDTGTATLQLPASGANVTWNYGNVIQTGQDSMVYFNCVPQASCASFNNANLLTGSVPDSVFEYYKTTANAFQLQGNGEPGVELHFTDPFDLYRFPFTYNTRYLEAFSGNVNIQGLPVPIVIAGTDSVRGAGYGTLITPVGTVQNTLLLQSLTTFMVTFPGQGTDTSYSYRFEWFEANSRYPLMQLTFDAEKGVNGQLTLTGSGGSYRTSLITAVTPTADPSSKLVLAPNPSTGMTRLEVPAGFQTSGAAVTVTDLTGKVVFQQALDGQATVSLNTTEWVKGLYLVQLQNAVGVRLQSRLSVL